MNRDETVLLTWSMLLMILARVEPIDWIAGLWTVTAVACLVASFVKRRRRRQR